MLTAASGQVMGPAPFPDHPAAGFEATATAAARSARASAPLEAMARAPMSAAPRGPPKAPLSPALAAASSSSFSSAAPDDADAGAGAPGAAPRRQAQKGIPVIEVMTAHAPPNFLYPYQGTVPEFSHSTAFAVEGQLLLTNAHCVAFATHVQVKRRDQDLRFPAEVVCIGFECDLAILVVRHEAFWAGMGAPVTFSAGLPAHGSSVTVLGFGAGGDNLCTTKGVVSRIDVQPYPWARGRGFNLIQLPVIQIDAAINPGNSGGPALVGERPPGAPPLALGVAFMGLSEAQSVGFIIPAKVATRFLEDFRMNGAFTNFGYPPFLWQSLDTEDMRSYYKAAGRGGVRVVAVDPNVDFGLKADDIVLDLFGEPIGHDGKVAVRIGDEDSGEIERVSLWYLFCDKFTRTPCSCRVLRDGQELRLSFELVPPRPLVSMDPAAPNEFLIVAGLVLQPMTAAYLSAAEAWHSFEAQKAFHSIWDTKNDGQQVVLVTGVLSHEVNVGISFAREDALVSINDERIKSLRHAAELVDRCRGDGEWLTLAFGSRTSLVVRASSARAATEELVERHGLQADRFLVPDEASKLLPMPKSKL